MRVRDVMNKNVEVINVEKSVEEAARMMRDGDYGALPVESGERLRGMITDRDIAIRVVAEGKDASTIKVEDCMSQGVDYCFDDEFVERVGEKMAENRHRRLPVLNRDKRLVGILSLGDIAMGEDSPSVTQQTYREIAQH